MPTTSALSSDPDSRRGPPRSVRSGTRSLVARARKASRCASSVCQRATLGLARDVAPILSRRERGKPLEITSARSNRGLSPPQVAASDWRAVASSCSVCSLDLRDVDLTAARISSAGEAIPRAAASTPHRCIGARAGGPRQRAGGAPGRRAPRRMPPHCARGRRFAEPRNPRTRDRDPRSRGPPARLACLPARSADPARGWSARCRRHETRRIPRHPRGRATRWGWGARRPARAPPRGREPRKHQPRVRGCEATPQRACPRVAGHLSARWVRREAARRAQRASKAEARGLRDTVRRLGTTASGTLRPRPQTPRSAEVRCSAWNTVL